MKQRLTCNIPSQSSSYEIEIHSGLLNNQAHYFASLASRFAIITDDRIAPLYGEQLQKSLLSYGLEVIYFLFQTANSIKREQPKNFWKIKCLRKGLGATRA